MSENSLLYTVECWCNINLKCKMVCAKNIAYITYNKKENVRNFKKM